MGHYNGFAPVYDADSRILILGSFPSVKSREQAFYYGNKQNRFWQVLAEAYGEQVPVAVEDKKRLCLSHGVALWDIVDSCDTEGSMDAELRNVRMVDLSILLSRCPICKILCNGSTAYRLTASVYTGALPLVRLPSTSPANVRFDKSLWLEQLKNN